MAESCPWPDRAPRWHERLRRVEWKVWIGRVSSASRAAFDLYVGLKRREPIYIAMAVADAVTTATEWKKAGELDVARELARHGATSLAAHGLHGNYAKFMYATLRAAGLVPVALALPAAAAGDVQTRVMTFQLAATALHFEFSGSYLEAVYGRSLEDALAGLSAVIRDRLGQSLALTMVSDGLGAMAGLAPGAAAPLAGYVSPIDVADFCAAVDRFHAGGLSRSSLLWGPPGVGKTTFASLVAAHLGARLLVVESDPLNRLSNSGLQLEQLIQIVDPRVVLFDDVDRIDRPERLLGEVERLGRAGGPRRLILGSVNDLGRLPAALRRPGRFDEIVEFKLPDRDLRDRILRAHLAERGFRLCDAHVASAVGWADGLSGAELREVALQLSVRGWDEAGTRTRIEHMLKMKGLDDDGPDGSAGDDDDDDD